MTIKTDDALDRPLHGAHLVRLADARDWAPLFLLYQQAQAAPFFTSLAEATTHLQAASFEEYCCRPDRALWVMQRGDRLTGFVLLQDMDATNRSANVDVGFFEAPFAVGAQDAALLDGALRQASAKHGLTRLQIVVLDDQSAKLALVESLGFQKEGVLRGHFFWQGTQRDLICLARLER